MLASVGKRGPRREGQPAWARDPRRAIVVGQCGPAWASVGKRGSIYLSKRPSGLSAVVRKCAGSTMKAQQSRSPIDRITTKRKEFRLEVRTHRTEQLNLFIGQA